MKFGENQEGRVNFKGKFIRGVSNSKIKIRAYLLTALALWGLNTGLTSCDNNKIDISEFYPTIEIVPEGGKVDITQGDEMLLMEGNMLKLGDKVIAWRDKPSDVFVKYKDSGEVVPKNLIGEVLEVPGEISIMLSPSVDLSPSNGLSPSIAGRGISEEQLKLLEDSVVTGTLILYTTQDFVGGLESLKNLFFHVGVPIDLTAYLRFNNVTLKEITITYPNQKVETKIDNPSNFVPKQGGKNLPLKIYVRDGDGEIFKCVTTIDVFPGKWDPISSSLESVGPDEVFQDLEVHVGDNEIYNSHVKYFLAAGNQMVQAMLDYGTARRSPEEYKKHLEKTVIVLVGESSDGNGENLGGGNTLMLNEQLLAEETLMKSLLPHARVKMMKDGVNNSGVGEVLKYVQTHPEEKIIICYHQNRDENVESNYEKNIIELRAYSNVILLTEGNYINNINEAALLWMIVQLNPNIKTVSDLKKVMDLSVFHNDTNNNGKNLDVAPFSKIWGSIKESLMPNDFLFRVNFSDSISGRYELKTGEYPFVIFDLQGAVVEYDGNFIPFNKENMYILENINLAGCKRFFDKEELINSGYHVKDYVYGYVYMLNENGEKLIMLNENGEESYIRIPIAIRIE